MTTIDDIKAAVSALGNAVYGANWVVVTQAQYDVLKADADRADTVTPALYRPDGTVARKGAYRGVEAFLGAAVVVREIGAGIGDLTGAVLDLRAP